MESLLKQVVQADSHFCPDSKKSMQPLIHGKAQCWSSTQAMACSIFVSDMANDLDQIDELLIAEHILAKLELPIKRTSQQVLQNVLSSREKATLAGLEKLEKTWQLSLQYNVHTYRSEERGEKIRFWSVPRKSAMVMKRIIELSRYKTILEIGTSAAYS